MPLEIRRAHFLIRSAQLVRGNTLRIGPGMQSCTQSCDARCVYTVPVREQWSPVPPVPPVRPVPAVAVREQWSPVQPSAHRHSALSTPSSELVVRHVAPLRHGELAHGPSAACMHTPHQPHST